MIRHVHCSSLYSESEGSLAAEVDKIVSHTDPEADLATYTEVKSREDALRAASPGWGVYQPDRTDVAVLWRQDTWEAKVKEAHKLTDKEWTDGQGHTHQTWAAAVLLERNNGRRAWVSLCHLPSSVQNGCQFKDNRQAAAWRGALDGWHKYWNNSRDRHKPDVGMLVADWNVDFHLKCWRQHLSSRFPSLWLCWRDPNMPPDGKGTHGGRLIDAAWSTVKADRCDLLPDNPSSDHRPWAEFLDWPD